MTRLLWVVGLFFALGVPGIPLAATFVARKMTKEVILISPADDMVEVNRALWSKGDSVPEIYGKAVPNPIKVVSPDPKHIIVPPEDPSLTLLRTDANYHPLQLQSVLLFAKWTTVASAALAVPLLLAAMVRTAKPNPAPAPAA